MSKPLNSPTAIGGKHYILIEDFNAAGELTFRDVLTYNDTAGDYGDAFDGEERAILETNEPLVRLRRGDRHVFRSMNAATLGL
jgi:hypothetical protein